MTESKEWVTIKVPKEIRNEAREDNRTYGEVMADGLNQERVGPLPDGEVPDIHSPSAEDIAEQLEDHIEYPERQDTETIINRLEDLESRLPRKVAEELR